MECLRIDVWKRGFFFSAYMDRKIAVQHAAGVIFNRFCLKLLYEAILHLISDSLCVLGGDICVAFDNHIRSVKTF